MEEQKQIFMNKIELKEFINLFEKNEEKFNNNKIMSKSNNEAQKQKIICKTKRKTSVKNCYSTIKVKKSRISKSIKNSFKIKQNQERKLKFDCQQQRKIVIFNNKLELSPDVPFTSSNANLIINNNNNNNDNNINNNNDSNLDETKVKTVLVKLRVITEELECPIEGCGAKVKDRFELANHHIAIHHTQPYRCFAEGCNESRETE